MDIQKLLTHMAWANKEIFTEVSKLPDSALESFADDPEWNVRNIISHICESATWYAWCLRSNGDGINWDELITQSKIEPTSSSDIHALINSNGHEGFQFFGIVFFLLSPASINLTDSF